MSTAQVIQGLHPTVAKMANQLLDKCHAEGINVVFTQGLRTFDEQTKLYNQGRTTSGQIVTNAKAGYSYHNYGLALDFALLDKNGKVYWNVDDKWKRVAELAKGFGFSWGGDWMGFKDYPHLECTFGLSVQQLLAGAKIPDKGEIDMRKEDVDFILQILGYYYGKMNGNKSVQDETHRVANELRVAVGREKE